MRFSFVPVALHIQSRPRKNMIFCCLCDSCSHWLITKPSMKSYGLTVNLFTGQFWWGHPASVYSTWTNMENSHSGDWWQIRPALAWCVSLPSLVSERSKIKLIMRIVNSDCYCEYSYCVVTYTTVFDLLYTYWLIRKNPCTHTLMCKHVTMVTKTIWGNCLYRSARTFLIHHHNMKQLFSH